MQDTNRWERIQSLFMEALDIDPEARAALLDTACDDDPEVRNEVEAMLAAHEQGHGLLLESRLISGEDVDWPGPDALIGTHAGAYLLKKLIGEGGMGAVYLGERDDGQYEQEVALKLVRPGLHSSEIITRFRVERQILARLQHPNIARLLDGGVTENGLPFLVMEYVEGTPLAQFCDDHHLPIKERLRLFRIVCQAVQFAHRNLVVHRDLKPNNILVTEDGRVKLLDFGIAKLLDPGAAENSEAKTRADLRIMTPEYAAPEQVRGEAITTATDVYALGVLLYELLTGHRPYRLPAKWQAHAERIICEEEPTRPSTVVGETETIEKRDGSTIILTPERVSAARNTILGRLKRSLQGDLDNIVMMALRKEPERRYASAQQISEDIGRYLGGRPVIARKDTFSYRLGKFIRRNRVSVGVTAGFVMLLLGFTVVTAVQSRRIASERDKSDQVSAFLSSLFAAADPTVVWGDTLTAIDILDRGAARIEAELADQPAVQAHLLGVMGGAYLNQGAHTDAEALARRALALQADTISEETLSSLVLLAEALQAQSRYPEADSVFRAVVLRRRAAGNTEALIAGLERRGQFLIETLGPPDTIKVLFEEALALRSRYYGTDDPGRGQTLLTYAGAYHVTGDYDMAVQLFREALREQRRFPDDPAATAETLSQLGTILSFRRQYTEADSMFREALSIREQIYGRTHPATIELLVNIAYNLTDVRRFSEAEELLRESLALYEQLGEHESNGYRNALIGLRTVYTDVGRYEEAVDVARRVVELTRVLFGPESRSYATHLGFHAQVLYYAGRYDESLDLYERSLPLLGATLGDGSPFYVLILAESARCMYAMGRSEEAAATYDRAYAIMEEKLPASSFLRSRVAFEFGGLMAERGEEERALALFADAASVRIAESSGAEKINARATYEIGRILVGLGRDSEAEPYLHEAYEKLREIFGEDHEETRAAKEAITITAPPE